MDMAPLRKREESASARRVPAMVPPEPEMERLPEETWVRPVADWEKGA